MANVSRDFNPYRSVIKASPNSNYVLKSATQTVRTSSESVNALGDQMLIILKPTAALKVSSQIYHFSSGAYVNREEMLYTLNMGDTTTEEVTLSFANAVQSATQATGLAKITGTVHSYYVPFPLAHYLCMIKKPTTGTITPPVASDILKATANPRYYKQNALLADGVGVVLVYCDDIPRSSRPIIPMYPGTNGCSLNRDLKFSDVSTAAIGVCDYTFPNGPTGVSPVATTWGSSPIMPVVIGQYASFAMRIQSSSTTTAASAGAPRVSVTMTVFTIAGNTVPSASKTVDVGIVPTSGTNVYAAGFSTTFILTPDSEVPDDCYVQFTYSVSSPVTTAVTSPWTLNVECATNQPGMAVEGVGRGSIVHMAMGLSGDQSVSITVTQISAVTPIPTLTGMQGPGALPYSGDLKDALERLEQDDHAPPFVFSLRDMDLYAQRYETYLDMAGSSQIIELGDDDEEIAHSIMRCTANARTTGVMPVAGRKWYQKAWRWLNKNITHPLAKPVLEALKGSAHLFGNVGAGVITGASNNLANNLTSQLLTSTTPSASYDQFLTRTDRLLPGGFTRRASTRQLNTMARDAIINEATRHYAQEPLSDLSTPETKLGTFYVDRRDVTLFPVVLEANYEVSEMFSTLHGGAMYAIIDLAKVPLECTVSSRDTRLHNFKEDPKDPVQQKPRAPIAFMKVIGTVQGKVILTQPANPVEGRSWELAYWAWERGVRGTSYAFTGSITDGRVDAIPDDCYAVKQMVSKRNGVILVGNNPIATTTGIKATDTRTLYRDLLIPRYSTLAKTKEVQLLTETGFIKQEGKLKDKYGDLYDRVRSFYDTDNADDTIFTEFVPSQGQPWFSTKKYLAFESDDLQAVDGHYVESQAASLVNSEISPLGLIVVDGETWVVTQKSNITISGVPFTALHSEASFMAVCMLGDDVPAFIVRKLNSRTVCSGDVWVHIRRNSIKPVASTRKLKPEAAMLTFAQWKSLNDEFKKDKGLVIASGSVKNKSRKFTQADEIVEQQAGKSKGKGRINLNRLTVTTQDPIKGLAKAKSDYLTYRDLKVLLPRLSGTIVFEDLQLSPPETSLLKYVVINAIPTFNLNRLSGASRQHLTSTVNAIRAFEVVKLGQQYKKNANAKTSPEDKELLDAVITAARDAYEQLVLSLYNTSYDLSPGQPQVQQEES